MRCPECGGECERNEADVVGDDGPWRCPACRWMESKRVGYCHCCGLLIPGANADARMCQRCVDAWSTMNRTRGRP